jgi:hypothetical protein
MADTIRAAEFRVFELERIVRMGIGGDDFAKLRLRECSYIVLHKHFKKAFLADPPHVVPRTALPLVENAEIDASLVQDSSYTARDVLQARIERSVVADKPENIDRLLAGVLYLEGKRFGPPLCLLKNPKDREKLEIFAPSPYRRGYDHNSFRPRFPALVPCS